MATFTTPHTAVTGEVTTAAQWNAEVRDNPTSLYEKLTAQVFYTQSQPTTNSSALVANQANLAQLIVDRYLSSVTGIRFRIGTSSGNYDIGIYDASFTRLWHLGATASAAAALDKSISAGTPTTLALTPGRYYIAFAADNGTIAVAGRTLGQFAEMVYTKATSYTLPTTISSPTDDPTATGIFAAIY